MLIDAKPEGLLPEWLRFLNGVVDSEDLPLNISREMLQDNSLVRKISDIITKRFIKHLDKLARDEKKNLQGILYGQFSRYLKEGVVTSWPNKESLGKLLRFESTATDAGKRPPLRNTSPAGRGTEGRPAPGGSPAPGPPWKNG